jgi:hypothetical protein
MPRRSCGMDIMGGVFLAGGREFKLVTGIDDHSRLVVIAEPSGRAVCAAFTAAMARYGVPSKVLTDNGKQFTGRFTKPLPAEVLFERVCREHGITQRLTKPGSPTTTRKDRALAQDSAPGAARRRRPSDCPGRDRCVAGRVRVNRSSVPVSARETGGPSVRCRGPPHS